MFRFYSHAKSNSKFGTIMASLSIYYIVSIVTTCTISWNFPIYVHTVVPQSNYDIGLRFQSSGRLLTTISEQSQLLSPKKLLTLQRQESVASTKSHPGAGGAGGGGGVSSAPCVAAAAAATSPAAAAAAAEEGHGRAGVSVGQKRKTGHRRTQRHSFLETSSIFVASSVSTHVVEDYVVIGGHRANLS